MKGCDIVKWLIAMIACIIGVVIFGGACLLLGGGFLYMVLFDDTYVNPGEGCLMMLGTFAFCFVLGVAAVGFGMGAVKSWDKHTGKSFHERMLRANFDE
jgi:hypothetical protein